MKKITRKGVIKKLDALVSKIVIERDKWCVCCGSTKQLTAGHLFSRTAYSTRWDLDNVYAQCWPCNYRQKVTGDPYPLTHYAEKHHHATLEELVHLEGWNWLEALHLKYVTPKKYKTFELEQLYLDLKK